MADIHVYSNGVCEFAGRSYACKLGKGGVVNAAKKQEGDQKTPAGKYPLKQMMYRNDRGDQPKTVLPVRIIEKGDYWCEDVDDPRYNTLIKIDNYHDTLGLWRSRQIFDIIVVIGHNENPVVAGKGSGIFMHLMNEDKSPSAGCITFERKDLMDILSAVRLDTNLVIHEEAKR